jgi:hypothetical protein
MGAVSSLPPPTCSSAVGVEERVIRGKTADSGRRQAFAVLWHPQRKAGQALLPGNQVKGNHVLGSHAWVLFILTVLLIFDDPLSGRETSSITT